MRHLRQKRWFICLLLGTTVLFSGCQQDKKKQGDEAEKITYRDTFTEEEKAKGTAKFDLMENMTVDAQITPVEKYKDGLKKYYMEHFLETETLKNSRDFEKKPTLFRQKLSKVMDIVAEKIGGTFSEKNIKWDIYDTEVGTDIDFKTTFKGNNGKPYDFIAYWSTGNEAFGDSSKAYCPCMCIEPQEGINEALDSYVHYDIQDYLQDYQNMEISFIKDKEKTGQELKEYLEKLLGRELSDLWDCVPVTAESVAALKKVYKNSNISEIKPEQEYCTYYYYYDVKGFRFSDSNLTYQLKEGETANKLAKMSSPNNTLTGYSNFPILCHVSRDGIIRLSMYNIRMEGDVYKETKKVIEPDIILQKVKKFYEKQILAKPTTVMEVEIIYTGYYTDGSEGEIQPTIAPFWRVRVYNGERSVYFFYDAFTGEPVVENRPEE